MKVVSSVNSKVLLFYLAAEDDFKSSFLRSKNHSSIMKNLKIKIIRNNKFKPNITIATNYIQNGNNKAPEDYNINKIDTKVDEISINSKSVINNAKDIINKESTYSSKLNLTDSRIKNNRMFLFTILLSILLIGLIFMLIHIFLN